MGKGEVKENDLMAIVTYVHVTRVGRDKLDVHDVDRNSDFQVIGDELVKSMYSADQYDDVQNTTLTAVAEKLSTSYNVPFTVEFVKKEGETRKLRGRLVKTEPILGRCYVEDLDIKEAHKLRQVDNRTIISLIVGGVKYVVK